MATPPDAGGRLYSYLGTSHANARLKGTMDDFRVWLKALRHAEVLDARHCDYSVTRGAHLLGAPANRVRLRRDGRRPLHPQLVAGVDARRGADLGPARRHDVLRRPRAPLCRLDASRARGSPLSARARPDAVTAPSASLGVEFAPPPPACRARGVGADGAGAVRSYRVEWDTSPVRRCRRSEPRTPRRGADHFRRRRLRRGATDRAVQGGADLRGADRDDVGGPRHRDAARPHDVGLRRRRQLPPRGRDVAILRARARHVGRRDEDGPAAVTVRRHGPRLAGGPRHLGGTRGTSSSSTLTSPPSRTTTPIRTRSPPSTAR